MSGGCSTQIAEREDETGCRAVCVKLTSAIFERAFCRSDAAATLQARHRGGLQIRGNIIPPNCDLALFHLARGDFRYCCQLELKDSVFREGLPQSSELLGMGLRSMMA